MTKIIVPWFPRNSPGFVDSIAYINWLAENNIIDFYRDVDWQNHCDIYTMHEEDAIMFKLRFGV